MVGPGRVQHDPQDRKAWFDLVAADLRTAASLLEEPDGAAKALVCLTREEPRLAALIKEDPANQRYRLYGLVLDGQMGRALAALKRDGEAPRRLERARAEAKGFQGGPNASNVVAWGIDASLRLAQLRAKTGDPAALSLANETATAITNAAPNLFATRWSQASHYGKLGSLYLQIQQKESATLWLEKSAAIWRQMTVPAVLEEQRRKALAAVERDLNGR